MNVDNVSFQCVRTIIRNTGGYNWHFLGTAERIQEWLYVDSFERGFMVYESIGANTAGVRMRVQIAA